MPKVRIGFIGAGGMGQMAHLSNYAAIPECEIVALAEPRPRLARRVAERYGIPHVFADHQELLRKAGVQAVVAAQPYRRHAILIPDILRARVPVFTEKPLCLGVAAGERLVALGRELNVLHMVGYHKRSDPAMEYARSLCAEWKASGEFGKMRCVRISMPPGDWIAGADKPLDSGDPNPAGDSEPLPDEFPEHIGKAYDVFVNYYIHQVNALRFLLGEPYRVTHAERSGLLLVGQSASGVCATLEMAPYHTTVDWQESILIGFEKGCIRVELPAPLARQRPGRVRVLRDNGKSPPSQSEPLLPPRSAMRQQALNFIAAVRGESPPPCTAGEALEDLNAARDYIRLWAAAT